MRKALLAMVVTVVVPALAITACKKKQEEPPPQQPYYGTPGYGTATAPGYGTAPTATAPATNPGGLSTPAPMAFPCQTDAQCLTHRCNTAVGKCAWPCQTNNDCMPGNQCVPPACVPAMGGAMPGAAPAPTQ